MKARVQKTGRKPSKTASAKASQPKRMTGQERSHQIVRVAAGLFARKGFKGTTTREIARKAGISEAVIFKHFSCKEDLYKAIIDSCCADSALEQQSLSELFMKTRALVLLGFLEGHIKELEKKGSIKAADPALCARAFIGMVIHYVIAQELYGFKRHFTRPNEVVAETFVDIFFEGMRRR